MKKLGVYIHIPFCIKKCLYCDFLSFDNLEDDIHRQYINTLNKELEYYSKVYDNQFIVDSVFFGGGTPSLIDPNLLKEVLNNIKKSFNVAKNAEITIECNPKTMNLEKFAIYKEAGINRISIGVQTFNDLALKQLGRMHQSVDAKETFYLARQAGFDNINIDLMFATPGHTMEVWQETLKQALIIKPEHISFYSLQLEEGTKYFQMFEKGELKMVSDKIDRDMYHKASEIFKESGYHHYEISNCAIPGYECKHNIKYWSMDNYLGLGLGAHSYINGERFSNTRELEKYLQAFQIGHGDSLKVDNTNHRWVDWQHTNTLRDNMVEFVITGMRKAEGISVTEFKNKFGIEFFEVYREQEKLIQEYIEKGKITFEEDRIKFTIKGVDISNSFLAEFV